MSQADAMKLAQMEALYVSLRIGHIVELSASALFFYDFLLTLPREAQYIWKRPFSAVTLLFVLNRYAVMSSRVVTLIEFMSWRGFQVAHADYLCNIAGRWSEVCTILMYLSIAGFSALRTYAIFRGNRCIFVFVAALGIMNPIASICYDTIIFFRAMPPPFTGCEEVTVLTDRRNRFFFIFGIICTIILETTALVLSWRKTTSNLSILRDLNASNAANTSYTALLGEMGPSILSIWWF